MCSTVEKLHVKGNKSTRCNLLNITHFGWHSKSPLFNFRAQRVSVSGFERFPAYFYLPSIRVNNFNSPILLLCLIFTELLCFSSCTAWPFFPLPYIRCMVSHSTWFVISTQNFCCWNNLLHLSYINVFTVISVFCSVPNNNKKQEHSTNLVR